MEELREAALTRDLREFRRYLRQKASERVKDLRDRTASDPFEWDTPAIAAVPGIVENNAVVTSLYHSLREGSST